MNAALVVHIKANRAVGFLIDAAIFGGSVSGQDERGSERQAITAVWRKETALQCDQMLELESCLTVSKSCLNNIHSSFSYLDFFQFSPKVTNLFGLLLLTNLLPIW